MAAGSIAGEIRPLYPEDLGPDAIDVSLYPEEHRKAYEEVFLPVFLTLGGPARAINSPIVELDPLLELAQEQSHPGLFSDARVAEATRDGWKRRVEEIRIRPPCCGACPVLSLKDARRLWRFLVYDSLRRKTGPAAPAWIRHRRVLLERFKTEHPERYRLLYGEAELGAHL